MVKSSTDFSSSHTKMVLLHHYSDNSHVYLFSSSSSQTQASRSRWLVGSSRSRRVGRTKRARAREIRILQPPEKSLHFLCRISLVKPGNSNVKLWTQHTNKTVNSAVKQLHVQTTILPWIIDFNLCVSVWTKFVYSTGSYNLKRTQHLNKYANQACTMIDSPSGHHHLNSVHIEHMQNWNRTDTHVYSQTTQNTMD